MENAVLVLVGNKSDLTQQRVIQLDRAQETADQLGVQYFETSAKDNINIKEVVDYLVDLISDKMAETIEKNPNFVPRGVRPQVYEQSDENDTHSNCAC